MLNLGPFKLFLFNSYIGNNKNPPITDEICRSLDVRYCCHCTFILYTFYTYIFYWRDYVKSGCVIAGFNCITDMLYSCLRKPISPVATPSINRPTPPILHKGHCHPSSLRNTASLTSSAPYVSLSILPEISPDIMMPSPRHRLGAGSYQSLFPALSRRRPMIC